jgi:hypothetical protein
MMVVGRELKGLQIIVLRMEGEDDANFKDAGRVHKGDVIIVSDMVVANAASF